MIQYGVTVLAKDMPFPSDCALSWIIWVAPFGRAVKRSSAMLRLLARTGHYRRGAPGGFLCPLGATASRLAEPINITLTEYQQLATSNQVLNNSPKSDRLRMRRKIRYKIHHE